jgi:hypothetical protein
MKKAAVSIVTLSYILAFSLYGQQPPAGPAAGPAQPAAPQPGGQQNQNGAQPAKDGNLILETLDHFEEAEDWVARSTTPIGETKILKLVQRGEIRAADDENARPEAAESISSAQDPNNPNHILGVKTWFEERGFDRVEVKPPHEYKITGKARQFSIWVLGRNFRHTLSIKLRDYRGTIHKLRLGQLDFFGWRKMTVTVPGWLPQSTRYSMLDKNLHFVSFFVTHDVHEVPGQFYFYMDGLKALVDKSEQNYPGSEIKDNW